MRKLIEYGKKGKKKTYFSTKDSLPWKKKKITCSNCKTDISTSWHSTIDFPDKNFCTNCFKPTRETSAVSWQRQMESKLPRNHFLGPKIKGQDMRGIYEYKKIKRTR